MENQSKWFITFGGPSYNYHKAVNRICSEAREIDAFNHIIGYTDKDLIKDTSFWAKHGEFITRNEKTGYGFWLWKSYLTKKTLEQMNDNDILVYADAGCTINARGKPRLLEYFDIVNRSPFANFSIQIPPYLEKIFTKMDIIHYYDAQDDANVVETGQLVGGIYILRKCKPIVEMVDKWYDGCCQYHLIDDSHGCIPNSMSYQRTRNDQSIFSVVRKKYGTETTTFDESWFAPNWKITGEKYPFWATRKRE